MVIGFSCVFPLTFSQIQIFHILVTVFYFFNLFPLAIAKSNGSFASFCHDSNSYSKFCHSPWIQICHGKRSGLWQIESAPHLSLLSVAISKILKKKKEIISSIIWKIKLIYFWHWCVYPGLWKIGAGFPENGKPILRFNQEVLRGTSFTLIKSFKCFVKKAS